MLWLLLGLLLLLITYCFYWVAFYNPESRHRDAVYPGTALRDQCCEALEQDYEKLPYEQVWITSRDGLRLAGRYYHIRDGGCLHIQFHGYRGSGARDLSAGNQVARSLGYNTLVVDQRAHGLSQGCTMTLGILERWDCVSWAKYAYQRFGCSTPVFLSGVSMGAATVLMASCLPLPQNVVGIIADCPYSSPADIVRKICRDVRIPAVLATPFGTAAALIWGRFWLFAAGAEDAVRRARVPILLIHGTDDKYIPPEMSRRIRDHCRTDCYLELFPGAAHGGSCLTDMARYRRILEAFVCNCLEKKET